MVFKEFLYNNASAISLMLPSNIIKGTIEDIIYKANPITIVIKDEKGKQSKAMFHDRHTYDAYVGKQKPSKGKSIYVSLNHNGSIKHIMIGHK